jgi:hypothetical protein
MERGTLVLALFAVIVVAVIGVSLLLQSQPPIEFTIAVDPLAEDWLRQLVDDFNVSNPTIPEERRVRARVIGVSDLNVWYSERANWTQRDHPEAWIPASTFSITYSEHPFEIIVPSVARTPLIWAAYADRAEALLQNGGQALDWSALAEVIAANGDRWEDLGGQASWGFVKMAFPLPTNTMSGFGVILSAAASHADSATLTNRMGRPLYDWLNPLLNTVPNTAEVGDDVASIMARGPSTLDLAIGPESQFLLALDALVSRGDIVLAYPEYQFVFDFPLAIWSDSATTTHQRRAVEVFADWLTAEEQQASTARFGLRPAEGPPTAEVDLFTFAVDYGAVLNPTFVPLVEPPTLVEARALLQWYTQRP